MFLTIIFILTGDIYLKTNLNNILYDIFKIKRSEIYKV